MVVPFGSIVVDLIDSTPLQEWERMMNVLEGPRKERRRVIFSGSEYWATPEESGLMLDDGRVVQESSVQHLPPCSPTKIICPHGNYKSRWYEFGGKGEPKEPTYFMKPISSLNCHNGQLIRPGGHMYLNYEGELAAVVGRITRNVRLEDVWDHLAGFTVANDAGLQDMRDTDAGSMLRVKGADTLCPIGPGIVSGVDVRCSVLTTYRNGQIVQQANIGEDMWFGVDYLVADIARHITLVPGDLVLTGTPANSRAVDPGDVIEVEISNVGRLRNEVVEGEAPQFTCGHQPLDSEESRRIALGNDEGVAEKLHYNG